MEKVKLTPEQYEMLKAQIESLKRSINKGGIFDKSISYYKGDGFTDLDDILSSNEFSAHVRELEKLNKMLSNAELITNINCSHVSVGTKVVILYEGSNIQKTHILVEQLLSTELLLKGYISVKSPLGSKIIGMKKDDKFSFVAQNGVVRKGTIISIEPFLEGTLDEEIKPTFQKRKKKN